MDAVTITQPAAALTQTAGGPQDSTSPVPTAEGQAPPEFAELLVASLVNLQQTVAEPVNAESTPAQSVEQMQPLVVAAAAPDAALTPVTPLPIPRALPNVADGEPVRAKDIPDNVLGARAPSEFTGLSAKATAHSSDPAMFAARPANEAPLQAATSATQAPVESAATRDTATLATDAQQIANSGAPASFFQPVEVRPGFSGPSALVEVAAPVSSPGFADQLSKQVVWMVDKDAQVAELRINPPELGPVEVRVTVTGEEAVAQFTSPHLEVRNAIEGALTRLREALAEAGIRLNDASVSADSFHDQHASQSNPRASDRHYGDTRSPTNAHQDHRPLNVATRRGLVDVYA
jgi:flagellar hook-length control protein FliK